jgi:predicted dehydrogenase
MYRHHPTWLEAVRLVRNEAIGNLVAVQSWFSYFNDDPTNIRNRVENGGGAVMDIGCYNVNLSRLLFDAEPVTIESVVHRDSVMGIDTLTSAILAFPGGGQSSFTCSIRSEGYQRVHIFGTTGRIEIEIPFNIPTELETRIYVTRDDGSPSGATTETVVFPVTNQYTIQAELFADAILNDSDVAVSPIDAVANMRVIDSILRQ